MIYEILISNLCNNFNKEFLYGSCRRVGRVRTDSVSERVGRKGSTYVPGCLCFINSKVCIGIRFPVGDRAPRESLAPSPPLTHPRFPRRGTRLGQERRRGSGPGPGSTRRKLTSVKK